MARVDYDRMAAVYDAGRDRTLDQRQAWREALGRHLPDAEFHAGLRRLEAAVAAEDPARPAGPVFGQIPLVVLAK
jgi:hypothetical protein